MADTLLVLPRPSRFDKVNDQILAGPARDLCNDTIPVPYDVCYVADYKKLWQNYKHIILTGQESLAAFDLTKTLSSTRGYVYHIAGHKIVSTFWPQDAVDLANHEGGIDEDDAAANLSFKDESSTSRANYRFWFRQDIKKLYATPSGIGPMQYNFVSNREAGAELQRSVGRTLYYDLESHPDTNTLTCFSYAFDDDNVKTACIYDHTGRLCPDAVKCMAGLQRAFHRNKIVIHNSGFDLLFLALFHGISFGDDIEDTMLMGHRIFPEAEKSLAHNISLYINAPYHKSEGGTWNPRSFAQLDQLLRYNSKDVYTLRAVHRAQWRAIHAGGDGLRNSVLQVNRSIFGYLYTSFHGLPINATSLGAYRRNREKVAAQWERVVQIMAGYPLNPGSPQQLADYFVNRMGYEVLTKTESGAPCVNEATLYKYLIRYKNPIIRAVLKYKRAQKVAGELGFKIFIPLKGR